ncbi:hypothetical protein BT96DRAFT_937153 [Gymnopus androsaceus JB14]|uniref:Uncharacterized protein n=1 Tax=Gymnopus androsaceus JB14 TaxID=1447944 RepID=A0A6A4HXQ4_9AGAR|nr:hypothetical protein BT96DRAFT_937153 [Gymnopus androsaceus JB14]
MVFWSSSTSSLHFSAAFEPVLVPCSSIPIYLHQLLADFRDLNTPEFVMWKLLIIISWPEVKINSEQNLYGALQEDEGNEQCCLAESQLVEALGDGINSWVNGIIILKGHKTI